MSFDQVQEFNDTYGVLMRLSESKAVDTNSSVRVREAKLRFELIREEFEELITAINECDIVEVADALGDIRYVVLGAAQVFGVVNAVKSYLYEDVRNYESQIFNPATQKETLQLLRLSILRDDADSTSMVLALILKMVVDGSEFLNIELDPIVDAIHKSNMSKLGENGEVIRRESDNKVLKGPNYVTPTADIENILFGEADADLS